MATQIWHYLENQFDNATKINFKLMNIINADHYAKLQAQQSDPDIAALLARTTAPHDNFNHAYSIWFSIKGIHKGETDRVDNYIHELSSTKIKQWDIAIQQVYLEGSSDYISILPNRRKPFQQGGTDARISQLDALGLRLAAYPALAATMNDVIDFYTTLNDARMVQQQKEGLLNNASDLTETARKEIATMMYRNLGALMDKYAGNLNLVSNFWELSLLSSGSGAVVAPPSPPPPPAATSITLISDQTILQAINLKIAGNASATGAEQFKINFGDGNEVIGTLANGILASYPHDYNIPGADASGIYTITITPITAGAFALMGVLQFDNCKLMGTVSIPAEVQASGIQIPNNLVTGVSMQAASYSNLTSLVPFNNAMSVSSVNANLIGLDNNGLLGGFANLGGGTNAAPSGAGLTAKNNLIAKGWTVMTN